MQCLSAQRSCSGAAQRLASGSASAVVVVAPVQLAARPQQRCHLHQRTSPSSVCATASSNGHAAAAAPQNHPAAGGKPSPAETARTVIDICREGTLSTLGADGAPLGTPVAFSLDKKTGQPLVELAREGIEAQNLARDARCSLQVQPTLFPARAVASVTLVGQLRPSEALQQADPQQQQGVLVVPFHVDKALYKGGLDQVRRTRTTRHAGAPPFPLCALQLVQQRVHG